MDEFLALAAAKAIALGLESAWTAIEAALRDEHPHLVSPPPTREDGRIKAEDEEVIASHFHHSER